MITYPVMRYLRVALVGAIAGAMITGGAVLHGVGDARPTVHFVTAADEPTPSADPTPEASPSPSPEPTVAPSPEPTALPIPEPTADPTPVADPDPTPAPPMTRPIPHPTPYCGTNDQCGG